jgi:hypothetical protein
MSAIIKNLAEDTTGIDNTSKKYRNNILNIYKHINNLPYTENDEMEISQFLKEKLQKFTDRKYYAESANNIKTGIINLKDSRIAAKGVSLLNAGKVKLKGSKILNPNIKDLKPRLIKCYGTFCSSISNNKYIKSNNKKQR